MTGAHPAHSPERGVGDAPPYPGAPASAPSFDDEIKAAVRYEKGLVVKAVVAIALVAVVLALRVYFFG
jgi:hypothetical protein